MFNSVYVALAAALNSAFTSAHITTVTFSVTTNYTIDSFIYPNVISYTGYIKNSQSQTFYTTLFSVMATYGVLVIVHTAPTVVSLPSNPSDDYYMAVTGTYVSQDDLIAVNAAAVAEDAFQTALLNATNTGLAAAKNAATSNGYTLNEIGGSFGSGTYVTNVEGSNPRTVVITISLSLTPS